VIDVNEVRYVYMGQISVPFELRVPRAGGSIQGCSRTIPDMATTPQRPVLQGSCLILEIFYIILVGARFVNIEAAILLEEEVSTTLSCYKPI
jgi:hypothetical protein